MKLKPYFSIEEVCQITNGKLIDANQDFHIVRDILVDSRKLIRPEYCVFFALISHRNDGHKYIEDLYAKGIRCFVVSRNLPEFTKMNDAAFILVKNTLNALQDICAAHRRKFDFPILGITGSNGKTIIKEWLFQLLQADYNIVRSPKSYNSQIGVPLSVWQMDSQNNLGIFEAGISEPDEMDRLEHIIKPDIGIFSNIGEPHSENFINQAQKIGEKLKLFKSVKTLIFCSDYAEITAKVIGTEIFRKMKAFSWGKKEIDDLIIQDIEVGKISTVKAIYNKEIIELKIPFSDSASIENAIHCWSYMLIDGYEQEVIQERFLKLSPIAMRLELKEGINACSVINDSYNSDFKSLAIALDFVQQQSKHKNKTLILSDILQSGRNLNDLYEDVAKLIESKGITKLIGIGNAISMMASRFNVEKQFFQSTQEFLQQYPSSSFRNETILLKGARVFEFEQIDKLLQQKSHETVLEIHLNHLVNNLNVYRSRIKKDTKIMAMVKAFSYGSGSFEIANLLQYHQVDYLAVAYVDEGVELRKAGINIPIMVMNPEINSFELMIRYQLEPEIYNFRTLEYLEQVIKQANLPSNKAVKIHLKLDTGMHRLGFLTEDIPVLIQCLQNNPMIMVQSCFSHLAASDDDVMDNFTMEQLEIFESNAAQIQESFPYPIIRHILNSAGITRFPNHQFEMVRLGIGLYGIAPEKNIKGNLQPIGTLKTSISQIKRLNAGSTVGYNRQGQVNKQTRIATIPIGYADGINRKLGNGNAEVLINGERAPIVGNVCMDMLMVDLKDIPAKEGDMVIIFGEDLSVEEIAEKQGTIPYEVLTGISRRVKRVYYHE